MIVLTIRVIGGFGMGGEAVRRAAGSGARGAVAAAACAAAFVATLVGPARARGASPLGPDAEGVYRFTAPSFNIECVYVPPGGTAVYKPPRGEAELSCDRAEPTYVHLALGARGPAVLVKDPGEQGCCAAGPALAYGRSLRMGPFTCASARAGMSCRRADGAGFTVSRARAETF